MARRRAWLGAGILAMLAAACAPVSAEQERGGGIVSLNPCSDAILAEIAPDRLVAISHYSHDPDSTSMDMALARRFPSTSGSAEEIAVLAPSLVVAGAFLNPATEQALDRMGIPVYKTGAIASIDDAVAQVRDLSAAVDQRAAGERLARRMETALAEAAPADGEAIPALVWQSGGLVPGEQTLVSDLLTRTGFTNWSAGRGLGQGAILPLEDVLADPPPLIISAGDGRGLHHPALAALHDTAQADYASSLLYCGGPTIPRAARRLAEIREGVGL